MIPEQSLQVKPSPTDRGRGRDRDHVAGAAAQQLPDRQALSSCVATAARWRLASKESGTGRPPPPTPLLAEPWKSAWFGGGEPSHMLRDPIRIAQHVRGFRGQAERQLRGGGVQQAGLEVHVGQEI